MGKKETRQRPIVVLNDYFPTEMPGAANIAFEFATLARKSSSAEFWCGVEDANTGEHYENLKIRKFVVNHKREFRKKKSLALRMINEIIPNRGFIWVCTNLLLHRPRILWINQIGLRFPRSIILFSNLMKIRTIVTVHDFTYIIPRKLYPRDINLIDSQVDEFVKQISSGEIQKLSLVKQKFHYIVLIRLFISRQMLRKATRLVFISDLQRNIYKAFGVQSGIVIANGVSECHCSTNTSTREPDTILFAGRSAGKGLENLLSQINDSNYFLHLAGGPELAIIASKDLAPSKFLYHGSLEQSELFQLMHKVTFVSVMSECFDVFPSVSLEAMRHGALVLCNRAIGSVNLVEQFSAFTIVGYNVPPDLMRLSQISKSGVVPGRKILRRPQDTVDDYMTLIKSIEIC